MRRVLNHFDGGNDIMRQQIQCNYDRIKVDVMKIIEQEMERIANDPNLKHLIGGEEE